MVAKILIKRQFKEGNTLQIVNLLHDIRSLAMSRPGYQFGETLIKRDEPNCMVVISTWNSMKAWTEWKNCQERRNFKAMLEVYQEGPTEYEEYLLGSPLHNE